MCIYIYIYFQCEPLHSFLSVKRLLLQRCGNHGYQERIRPLFQPRLKYENVRRNLCFTANCNKYRRYLRTTSIPRYTAARTIHGIKCARENGILQINGAIDRRGYFLQEISRKRETGVTLFSPSRPNRAELRYWNSNFFSSHPRRAEHSFLSRGYKFKRGLASWFN